MDEIKQQVQHQDGVHPRKTLLSWSSGKDSAWALHLLRQDPTIEVVGLLTTFNQAADRVAMHAVRRSIVRQQAQAARLPLWEAEIPSPCSNAEYERVMAGICHRAVDEGITHFAFGDLFLRDIREYRERQLSGTGLEPIFPVWDISTDSLARTMIASGLRARLTCVDPRKLDSSFAGREFDLDLLNDLPADVDPCGENGEFHSCVYAGPFFRHPLQLTPGEVVERDGFVFADLVSDLG